MPVLYLITVIAISIAIVLRLTNPEEIAILGITGFAGISLFFCVALTPLPIKFITLVLVLIATRHFCQGSCSEKL
jgi:hypothetical protein